MSTGGWSKPLSFSFGVLLTKGIFFIFRASRNPQKGQLNYCDECMFRLSANNLFHYLLCPVSKFNFRKKKNISDACDSESP